MLDPCSDPVKKGECLYLEGRRLINTVTLCTDRVVGNVADIVFVEEFRCFIGKKEALYTAVLLYRTMVVEVITRDIGMHFECKVYPLYTLLIDRVGADFHDKILCTFLGSLFHIVQGLEYRWGGHALLFKPFIVSEKSACPLQCRLLSQIKQKGVDRRSDCRLAVGAGHADHFHLVQIP